VRRKALLKVKVMVAAGVMAVPVLGVAAAPAHACGGNRVCDTINKVCDLVVGPCIP
jgi:hypothetical protein